jgi:hypothetical protein
MWARVCKLSVVGNGGNRMDNYYSSRERERERKMQIHEKLGRGMLSTRGRNIPVGSFAKRNRRDHRQYRRL